MNERLVYHYCDVSTAVSILKNRELWMTNMRNLSDSNESTVAYRMFFNLLENMDSQNNHLTSLFEFARTSGAIELYTNPLGAYSDYVACFSEEIDSVSQWISYADNGRGIAIGFDESELEQLAKYDGLNYQGITYLSEKDIEKYIPSIYNYLIENIEENNLCMMDKAMDTIQKIFPQHNMYKSFHYESEHEKRLVYDYPTKIKTFPDGWGIKNVGVYAAKNKINTYIPLEFPTTAVKSIITGPKYEANGYEVEGAMEALGYLGINILHSTSGYR